MTPKTKIRLLILGCVAVLAMGLRCTCAPSGTVQQRLKAVRLVYWRVYDSSSDFNEIISSYRVQHSNISVTVQNLRLEEFEDKLKEAYADLKPPDLISLHYGWLPYYVNKKYIAEMPKQINMVYQFVKKTAAIKEEVIIEERITPGMTLTQLKNDFLDTVAENVVVDGKIYGLPLSVDTLVLYYNRDILDRARIPLPPTTWQELQEAVKKTTYLNSEGVITQAGIGLGTADNVRRSPDILMLLMRQNGAEIIRGQQVLFSKNQAQSYNPGLEAIRFYTDFANPRKEVYSWNNDMPDALQAFADKKTAFYIGYSFDLPQIKAYSKNSINLGISKIPQIENGQETNMANFWVEVVSSRTKYPNEAWDFLLYLTKKENAAKFLESAKHPTALRSLVDTQLQDEELNVFASQLLTAQTWYRGYNHSTAEDIIKSLVNEINEGKDPVQTINLAANRMTETLRAPQ